MSSTIKERHEQLQAFEPRLMAWAENMTRDAREAETLVQATLAIARSPAYASSETVDAEVWIFRLLRQQFYSLERDRDFRRSRSAFATEQSYARKRAVLAQAVADGSVSPIEA